LLSLLLPPRSTLFPYTTLFRSSDAPDLEIVEQGLIAHVVQVADDRPHSNDDALSARLDLPPRRERKNLPRNLGGAVETQIVRQRSEEHTSELQSLAYLVCRLLL